METPPTCMDLVGGRRQGAQETLNRFLQSGGKSQEKAVPHKPKEQSTLRLKGRPYQITTDKSSKGKTEERLLVVTWGSAL